MRASKAADAAVRGGCGGAAAVPLCVRQTKNKAADGSLACYLCLIAQNLFSSFFSGLGDFFPKKSRAEREAEPRIYSFSHGRGVGQRPTYIPLMSGCGTP